MNSYDMNSFLSSSCYATGNQDTDGCLKDCLSVSASQDGDYPSHTFFWRQLRVKYYDNTDARKKGIKGISIEVSWHHY